MSLTCGLNQEGAYILGNNVYVNTLKTFPSVIENKTYLITKDDGTVNTKAMIPVISENVNEKNLDDFKNFLVNNKVTEIPTLTEPFIAEIGYNLVDDRGIILNSTAKINNVGLINCAILSDIDENNSMTYKLGRYFNISGIIDLPKDKSLSIRYEKANKVLQLNITSLTIYGTLSEKPYTFDKDVADTYFKYILSLEERERNRLLNKYK